MDLSAGCHQFWTHSTSKVAKRVRLHPIWLDRSHLNRQQRMKVNQGPSTSNKWRFPKMGVPLFIHFRLGFSHGNQPSSYWIPPFVETPQIEKNKKFLFHSPSLPGWDLSHSGAPPVPSRSTPSWPAETRGWHGWDRGSRESPSSPVSKTRHHGFMASWDIQKWMDLRNKMACEMWEI